MSFFRVKPIKNFFLLVTGVTFFNLSFFLAEVSGLELRGELIQVIAQLLSNGGLEEEREAAAENAEITSHLSLKEMHVTGNDHIAHHASLFLLAHQRNGVLNTLFVDPICLERFSPPPES